ncbi:MAG: T9SS type A sorting domain-containing protein [Muribaculaceae bacterium]|nr:T9SS type A sorting domain-containing protein [Muribaculaceae bacterium]
MAALTAIMIAGAAPTYAALGKWESVRSERSDAMTVARDNDVEVRAAKGLIVVNTSKPVQVRIYTILGQLVSRETIPQGTSQIAIAPHGVYIIRIGDLTCKAAL